MKQEYSVGKCKKGFPGDFNLLVIFLILFFSISLFPGDKPEFKENFTCVNQGSKYGKVFNLGNPIDISNRLSLPAGGYTAPNESIQGTGLSPVLNQIHYEKLTSFTGVCESSFLFSKTALEILAGVDLL